MVAVNRWDFDGDEIARRVWATVSWGVTRVHPIPIRALPGQVSEPGEYEHHVGLGLTEKEEEECNKMLPFAFLNVQYRSDQTKVDKAMETELDSKWRPNWKSLSHGDVRVKAQSEPLNDLIDAVRKSNDSATLKHVFDSAKSTVDKPTDLTEEKLNAVEEEILRREDLEAAEESLTKAVEAFDSFKEEGTSKHAETFVQKLDTAMQKLPDGMTNRKVSIFEAFVGHAESCLGRKERIVPRPAHGVAAEGGSAAWRTPRKWRRSKAILSAWNIKLSKDQLNQLYILGLSLEVQKKIWPNTFRRLAWATFHQLTIPGPRSWQSGTASKTLPRRSSHGKLRMTWWRSWKNSFVVLRPQRYPKSKYKRWRINWGKPRRDGMVWSDLGCMWAAWNSGAGKIWADVSAANLISLFI